MSGISDVARRAGVSKATASRALTGHGYVSPDTRARVQDAARALGYVASSNAASLVTGRTRTIGVIMPYLNRWFFAEVLEGIQDALLEHGLDLTLYDARPGSHGRRLIFEDFLARKRFDGLIAVGLEPEDRELERLVAVGRPIVSVVGVGADSSAITLDDDAAARRAAEHLLALGHRRIAFLGGDPHDHWADVDRRRLDGYTRAMTDAGLAHEVCHIPSAVTMPGGYAAAVDLLSDASRRPTGLVGVCDEVAIGAIIAARRLGILVPGDLSVVGIDDHEFAEMFALTTLAQDPRAQGAEAVRVLLDHITDPGAAPVELQLQARLIVRSSTAPVDRASSAIEANTGRR
nr:LacI family DNA-binding transcriptional regulator [Microbacterium lemovicicum]